jgi:hypothetical protein
VSDLLCATRHGADKQQVSDAAGSARFMAHCAGRLGEHMRAAHAPLRLYILGPRFHSNTQPGMGKGAGWAQRPGHECAPQLRP